MEGLTHNGQPPPETRPLKRLSENPKRAICTRILQVLPSGLPPLLLAVLVLYLGEAYRMISSEVR